MQKKLLLLSFIVSFISATYFLHAYTVRNIYTYVSYSAPSINYHGEYTPQPAAALLYSALAYVGSNIQLKQTAIVNCKQLFEKKLESAIWPPPCQIPKAMLHNYTFDGQIPILLKCFAEKQNNGIGYNWHTTEIEKLIMSNPHECYGTQLCSISFQKYKKEIYSKKVIVFGSQSPWAEAMLLRYGAAHVLTYEYMNIITSHPKLTTMTPSKAKSLFLQGKFVAYDAAFSYSSFEHDGLGRYGDLINPYGDLESIAKVSCLIKPGGLFFLALPVGSDAVVWNAHRIYGRKRLPMALSLWDLVDIIGPYNLSDHAGHFTQPVLVLRNRGSKNISENQNRAHCGQAEGGRQ